MAWAPAAGLAVGLVVMAAGHAVVQWGSWWPALLAALATGGCTWFFFRRALDQKQSTAAEHARLVSQMRSMLEHATVGLVITIDRRMVIVSRAFWTMFGYEEHEMLGQPGRLIYASDESYADIGPRVGKAFAERGQFDTEIQMMRKDGSLFWCQLMGRPVDPKNMSAGTMWVLYDISDMRAQREQLEWASSHDSLTGLANRAAFERALDRLLEQLRQGERKAGAAVLLMDLDRFKQVNDTGGHAAGDQLLRDIAALMTGRLRQSDVVARVGGDEFAVLLDNCDSAHAMEIAESLRRLVSDYRLAWAGQAHSVGVSIGVQPIGEGVCLTREQVLAAADAACYEAKHAGRGRVCAAG
jgi:diguanylate cyclase (GGDEF)-like protein/PAS domain S-box-containing protein